MSVNVFVILIRHLEQPVGTSEARVAPVKRNALQRLLPNFEDRYNHNTTVPAGNFVACLSAISDLHVPVTRNFTVTYPQLVLSICLKVYNCSEDMVQALANSLDAFPQLDQTTFAVHHVMAVRCVERWWAKCAHRGQSVYRSQSTYRLRAVQELDPYAREPYLREPYLPRPRSPYTPPYAPVSFPD